MKFINIKCSSLLEKSHIKWIIVLQPYEHIYDQNLLLIFHILILNDNKACLMNVRGVNKHRVT